MRDRRAIRLVLTVLLFLGLGFTTSVAVAWGATVRFIVQTPTLRTYMAWQIERTIIVIPASASMSESGVLHWGNYTDHDFPFWSQYRSPPKEAKQRSIELAAGWPFYCLKYSTGAAGTFIYDNFNEYASGSETLSYDYFAQRYDGEIYGSLDFDRFKKGWRSIHYLPRDPIELNLLLDATFWGVVWLLLFNYRTIWRLFFWLIRAPRQRCVWCGYDLQQLSSDRCPECGKEFGKLPTLLVMPALRVVSASFLLLVGCEVIFVKYFVSQREGEPIHAAVFQGDLEQLKVEIARGADINLTMKVYNFKDHTPLWLAIRGGYSEVFDHLLELGADYNYFTTNRGNALTLAIQYEQTDFISKLLDAGVAVNTKTGDWREPLIAAIRSRHRNLELVDTLIKAGADVNLGGLQNMSPLQFAAYFLRTSSPLDPKEAMFRLLLQAGANPNPPNTMNGLPLHLAVEQNKLSITRMLLEYGADPTALDRTGKKAVEYIESPTRDVEMNALLEEYEAKWIAEHGKPDEEQTP